MSSGAGVEFWISRSFGIEIDLLYVQKGHEEIPGLYSSSDGSFPTLSFPVLLRTRIQFKKDSPLSLGFMGGIAPTLILQKMDTNGVFAKHDFTILVGTVFELQLKNVILLLDARYDWGLNTLSIEYIPSRASFKTSTLYVMIGFKLGL
ncbi:outer membrane beta-barrel protein [Acidobacteriota bacterium]